MELDVMAKARELGETLQGSVTYLNLMNAQDAMEEDDECADLLNQMNEVEQELQELMKTESPESPNVKLKAAQYKGLRQKAEGVGLIAAYQEAAGEFQQMMTQVNQIIQFYLTGEDADSCSGSCEGCSGCAH